LEVLKRRTNGFTAVCVANVVVHPALTTSELAVTVLLYPVMVEFCTTATANDSNVQVPPLPPATPTIDDPVGEYQYVCHIIVASSTGSGTGSGGSCNVAVGCHTCLGRKRGSSLWATAAMGCRCAAWWGATSAAAPAAAAAAAPAAA